jgi:type II secretory pathway pseudopilin PulG
VGNGPRARTPAHRCRRLAQRLRREEDGVSLIELVVTMSMALTILAALLGLWSSAASDETVNAARYQSIDDASRSLERMTREVREAISVVPASSSVVNLRVWKRGLTAASTSVPHDITYDCSGAGSRPSTYACRRTDVTAASGPALVIDGLASRSVFTTMAGQPALKIELSVVVASQSHPIVLRSGASPRNCPGALSSCT